MKENPCFGVTRNLHRCKRTGNWLIFCPQHLKQWLVLLSFLIFVVGGGISSDYSLMLTSENSSKQKSTIKEYQISISPGGYLTAEQRNLWVTNLAELIKSHGFNPFILGKEDAQTIELIGLFDIQREEAIVKDLMKNNGFLVCNPSINRTAVLDRQDKYDVEFELDKPKMNLEDWANWISEMEELFENNRFEYRPSYHYENPMVMSLPYPPWREITKIMNLIKKKGLILPTRFIIYENDITATSLKNMLLTIDSSNEGITISGFIPFKSIDEDDFKEVSKIKMTITDKSGKMYTSQLNQTLAEEFSVVFPSKFIPHQTRLLPGRYQLRIYVNPEKAWDTEFQVDQAGSVDWDYSVDRRAVYRSS
jgi:hypothetical protein